MLKTSMFWFLNTIAHKEDFPSLCAAHVAINHKNSKTSIHLETYGSPRTLGEKLSTELVTILGKDNIVRFVNKDDKGVQDMVTRIPLESVLNTQYRHVGDPCILTPIGPEIYEGFPKLKILRTPPIALKVTKRPT